VEFCGLKAKALRKQSLKVIKRVGFFVKVEATQEHYLDKKPSPATSPHQQCDGSREAWVENFILWVGGRTGLMKLGNVFLGASSP
jgi:hypothetical protein